MIYRLDPTLPLVWRTPFSVQLGVDPPVVVIEDVTEAQEKMLAALTVGVTAAGLQLVANGSTAKRDELLELIDPAIERPPDTDPVREVTICGSGGFVDTLARALASDAIHVTIVHDYVDLPDSRPDIAIVVAAHVVPPAFHGVWLRRDVPHLSIVFSETASVVGPVVEPGTGPCLLCLELHRRDADASWPAIATQLLGRGGGADSPALLLESAAEVCRVVAAHGSRMAGHSDTATSVRIDGATGERTSSVWAVHPGCGCTGLPPLGERDDDGAVAVTSRLRETDWAAAALDPA